jgi:hypothetical protein
VTTERSSVNINVKELDNGSWVIFELPDSHQRSLWYGAGQPGCAAQGHRTSYYKGNGSLWVKLVSTGDVLGSGPGQGPGPETASRSAGKQQPCCTTKAPGLCPGPLKLARD